MITTAQASLHCITLGNSGLSDQYQSLRFMFCSLKITNNFLMVCPYDTTFVRNWRCNRIRGAKRGARVVSGAAPAPLSKPVIYG